jgi:hypothetical protein
MGNAISVAFDPEMLPLELLSRLLGSLQLLLHENGRQFRARRQSNSELLQLTPQ